MKRIRHTSSVTSDDDNDTPFDPASLFNLKKENDIKVDGNKIYFYKGVSRDSVLNLIGVLNEKIKKLKAVISEVGSIDNIPIYLFINSEGGDYFAGLSAMDHIKNMNYPIYTVIDGMVASAATFISLAGTKRYITRSSWVLVHQIRSWFGGMYTHEQLKDEMENSGNIMKSLNIMYSEHTRIPKKKLDQFFKHDLYIDSTQALKYGIVEHIYYGNDSDNSEKKQKKNNTKIIIT